jgi:hypothetical protein
MKDLTTRAEASTNSTLLYLPVSPASPDPLGISNVSGMYGPGTWAGWYLTIVASWIRLFLAPKKRIDPNTWAFLLVTNWAAGDFILQTYRIRFLNSNGNGGKAIDHNMGPLGAAYTVLWVGVWHAGLQLAFAIGLSTRLKTSTLVVGLFLPLIALCFSVAIYPTWNRLPVLYYPGMQEASHRIYVGILFLTPMWVPLALFIWFYYLIEEALSTPRGGHTQSMATNIATCLKSIGVKSLPGFTPVLVFTFTLVVLANIMARITKQLWWYFCAAPFDALMAVFIWPIVLTAGFAILCYAYIMNGYLQAGSKYKHSCFFMPCAPQSISDSDQAFPLMLGIILLLACELAPQVWKIHLKQKKAREDLEAAGRRIEMELETRQSG